MISKKTFVADGSNTRFLSDFIIRSEQFTRVYNYIYDMEGVAGEIDPSSGLYIRNANLPSSEDLVTINYWDLVDNSISFYTTPYNGSMIYIEVATTPEEFGDTLVQPSVERALEAADEAALSAVVAAASEVAASNAANAASSSANAASNAANAASSSAGSASLSATQASSYSASASSSASQASSYSSGASSSASSAYSSKVAAEIAAAKAEAVELGNVVLSDTTLIPQTSTKIDNMVEITQANYDLLTPDTNTMYVIVG